MASNVARCEPPEEHRSERWHWLEVVTPIGDGEAEPWWWNNRRSARREEARAEALSLSMGILHGTMGP